MITWWLATLIIIALTCAITVTIIEYRKRKLKEFYKTLEDFMNYQEEEREE